MAELRIGSVGMSRLAVQPSSWLGIGFLGIGGLGIGTLETGFVDLQVVDSTSNCHSLVMIFAMLGIAWDENDHIGDVNDSFGDINGIKPSESHILDSIWVWYSSFWPEGSINALVAPRVEIRGDKMKTKKC